MLRRARPLFQAAYSKICSLLARRVGRFFVPDLLLLLFVALYSLVFSYLSMVRMYSLYMHAWDLGNYNQALYTTLKNGVLLHYTADLAANPSGSILGVHFSLILLLLLPFYAIAPRPETLLVLQSVFIGIGAIPIYLLARAKGGSRSRALVFATVYLVNPAIQGINWVEFHPEAFIPAFALFSLYYLETKRWKMYYMSTLLTLSTLEPAAFLVLLTALSYGWRKRTQLVAALRERKPLSEPLLVTLSTASAALVWLFVALSVVRLYNPNELTLFGGIYTWQTLGANSLLSVPLAALLSPTRAFTALTSNSGQKIVYLFTIFGTLGLLPLLALSITAIGFAWLGVALLSDNPIYYSIATQYPAFVIPYAVAGAVHASKQLTRKGFAAISLYAILSGALLSPLVLGGTVGYSYAGPYGPPSIVPHDQSVASLVSMIPENASVLTQDNVFPLVSSRYNAYVVPTRSFFPIGTSFQSELSNYLGRVDYALFDPVLDPIPAYYSLAQLKALGFGLKASSDGALLFEKDYAGPPALATAYTRTYNYADLELLCCRSAVDPDAHSRYVFAHDSASGIQGNFWTGPWTLLAPGEYRVDFRMKILQPTQNYIITLGLISYSMEVALGQNGIPGQGVSDSFLAYPNQIPTEQVAFPIYPGNFSAVGQYVSLRVVFKSDSFQYFTFPGMKVSSSTTIFLDNIVVTQQATL